MSKIRIGIDVDGVLRKWVEKVQYLALEEGVVVPDPDKYEFLNQEINGSSIKKKLWGSKEWQEPCYMDADAYQKGIEGYFKFCEDPKFNVYIVSAQPNHECQEYTDYWLEKQGLTKHIDTIYTSTKLDAPCQILIDDKVSNVRDYDISARQGFLIDKLYNQEYDTHRRVKDLTEAYNKITEDYGRN